MEKILVVGPSAFPVSLAEAKANLNISHSNDDDLIYSLIAAATLEAEQFLRRKLVSQTWKIYLDEFPATDYIKLPFGQLRSVTAIKYTDSDGDETTWSSDDYIVDTVSEPGRIVLGYGKNWPTSDLYPSNPIEIEFVCGFLHGPIWAVDTVKAVNDVILPTAANQNGLAYQCSASVDDFKTHAETEPTWPTTNAATVVDDKVTWACAGLAIPEAIRHAIKILIADKKENPESIISGTIFDQLPTIANLLMPYKIWDWF